MAGENTLQPRKPVKALVTGGGGFIGGAIVEKLVHRGDSVCSFSRNYHPQLASVGVDQYQGDISDPVAVEKACKDQDVVFHVAGKPGIWGRYRDYYNTNVVGTQNVVAACQRYQIRALVHTSSPSVIFNGQDMEGVDESMPYPKQFHTHYHKPTALAEQFVIRSVDDNFRAIILRPHLVWGPKDVNLVPRIISRAKRLTRVGNGKNLIDTVYIDNVADAHVLAADKLMQDPKLSGKIYFISQDDPIYLWDIINAILKAAGMKPVKRAVSHRLAWLIGGVFEIIYKLLYLKAEPQMTRHLADELVTAHWFDISAAKRDLGYVPRVSTKEGLRRLEDWLRKQYLPGG
jgi:nucleoside-diphosphate-sugar epimerase